MDINRFSFGAKLPAVLTAISKAHFLAIDLELSGIHTKLASARSGRPDGGKPALQDRYRECKEAAEKYQVLQVGITCVEEDKETGVYVARPYNFNLSPLIEYKIDFDRDFTFQSGAITFLLDHGFRFDNSVAIGVPYLSRQEEADVRLRARNRSERSKNIADLKIREDDTASLEFVQRAREQIRAWTSKTPYQQSPVGQLHPEYLNIAPINFDAQPQSTHGLNNFQKRLIHQLVRAEFPGFVTLSRPTFIQILPYDEAREASYQSSRQNALNAQISKQTGLRWVVEAMVGGDLSGINPMDCAQNTTGESVFIDKEAISSQMRGLRDALHGRRTILVGHNLFTDLINFYKAFIGDLPEEVEDFQKVIHQIFPMVIDTKYLATHEYDSINLRSSLEDLEEDLRAQIFPTIKLHYDHSKYLSDNGAFAHEAGYDSFITARVLIKLATRLEAEGDYVKVEAYSSDDSFMTAPECGDYELNLQVDTPNRDHTRLFSNASSPSLSLLDMDDGDLLEATGSPSRPSKRKRRKVKKPSAQIESQFSHPTIFDLLGDLDEEGGFTEHQQSDSPEPRPRSKTEPESKPEPKPEPEPELKSSSLKGMNTASLAPDEHGVILMPSFDTDFWRVYGNKLRVFGTKEEIFRLAT
ncbi:hypothetical protein GP486_003338 [Trichoglossum hirsutum]|uniref:CAF1-domain-containing protein n=1 Tax=Trichoglossum hirsutum TaxID=265104 RepID=A0A9P8LDA5_9PEZI|nr:hypothetical protein GP486_003338 [Trichoglossum hirsutum]